MLTLSRRCLVAALLLTGTGLAQAQTAPPPVRIRGTIQALDGNVLTVTTREGPIVKVTLNDPLTVATVKKLGLADIAPGSYIGTAAMPGPDGTLTALEVLVFPPTARGTGEGHGPWDLAANSTMTNANVEAVLQGTSGHVLTLTPKGQIVKVVVPPNVPIVTPAPAQREDLKPGQTIFIFAATRAADGSLSASRVTVSKHGVAPPM